MIARLKPTYEGQVTDFEGDVKVMEGNLLLLYRNRPEYFETFTEQEFISMLNTGECFPGIDMLIYIPEGKQASK